MSGGTVQPESTPYARRVRAGLMYLCLVVAMLSVAVAFHGFRGGFNWPPVRSDGEGYFAYLPALVIHKTLDLRVLAGHFGGVIPSWAGLFRDPSTGRIVNIYPVGVALLLAPFFLIAHVATVATRIGPADGYSILYQLTPLAGAVSYYAVGIYALAAYVQRFLPSRALLRAAIVLTFGTSLFHYTTYDAVYSHVYSFCFVALLLLASTRFWTIDGIGSAIAAGAILGTLFLIRNYNVLYWVIFVAYPFALGNSAQKYAERRSGLLIAGGVAFAVAALQPVTLKLMTGRFVVNPYAPAGIGFDFRSPHFLDVLFSFEKGAFIWAPILLLGVAGLIVSVVQHENRELRVVAGMALGILICLTYLIGSWRVWHLGGGFGHRAFVDSYPLFAIGLAVVFARATSLSAKLVLNACAIVAALVTVALMYSYWVGKVPFGHSAPEARAAATEYVAALRTTPRRVIALFKNRARDSTSPKFLQGKLRDVTVSPDDGVVRAGTPIAVAAVAENTGRAYWLDAAPRAVGRVALAVLWFRSHGHVTCSQSFGEAESRGTILLPSIVEPGESVRLAGTVPSPARPGRYVMLLDLVSENVTWFRERGLTPHCHDFQVK